MSKLMYDPPSGWMYGFPKPYLPKPDETIEDTLRRDGYPEHEIKANKNSRGVIPCRFFGSNYDASVPK